MPYTATTRTNKRKLIPGRWYDSEDFLSWAVNARAAAIQVISERVRLRAGLEKCVYNFEQQMGDDQLFVDSTDPSWSADFQKLFTFLSDRTNQRGESTDAQGSATEHRFQMGSAQIRAWTTALDAIVNRLLRDQDVVDKTTFTTGLVWGNE